MKSIRSNSFDVSILKEKLEENRPIPTPSNWFLRRHQPSKIGDYRKSFQTSLKESKDKNIVEKEPSKVMWDERSGSLVDPHALGSAIEVFLRQASPSEPLASTSIQTETKSTKVSQKVDLVGLRIGSLKEMMTALKPVTHRYVQH